MLDDVDLHNAFYKNAITNTAPACDIRNVRLVVDSRERNTRLFPNPNSYEINIPDAILNVGRIKMVSSSFPFSAYLINANNNLLHFTVGSTKYTAMVDIGDYSSGADLATALQSAINAAYGSSAFRVAYVPRTDNFKVSATTAFTLNFMGNTFVHTFNENTDVAYKEKTIAAVIGFANKDYTSAVQAAPDAYVNVVSSEFRKNFDVNDTLVVNVGSVNLNRSTSETVNHSFAVISKTGVLDSKTLIYDTHQICKFFTPPIKRLSKLKITITDYYGNPYDFQNQDHRMEFILDSQILKPI